MRSRTRTEAACLAAAVADLRRRSATEVARRHLNRLPTDRREALEQEWAA